MSGDPLTDSQMRKRKPQPKPAIVCHRVLTLPRVIEYPRCCAPITTESSVSWRMGNIERTRAKADRLGVGELQCFQTATYQIGDEWFCRKHAALMALDMLSVHADQL